MSANYWTVKPYPEGFAIEDPNGNNLFGNSYPRRTMGTKSEARRLCEIANLAHLHAIERIERRLRNDLNVILTKTSKHLGFNRAT